MYMNARQLQQWVKTVEEYYRQHGRHELPWRLPGCDGSFDPYKIMVSELMLQQTQVQRVLPKYEAFLATFPNIAALAAARLGEVLVTWSGLGYNRRAKYLWQAAQQVQNEFNGNFPRTVEQLVRLPGVGHNTAGAIVAYAYNQPAVFVETNIRTVIIHHFYDDQTDVTDAQIRTVLEAMFSLDPAIDYRQFYWALMDYGTFLKQTVGNTARSSKSYKKQSPFHGSKRQLRGRVLKLLAEKPMSKSELLAELTDDRSAQVLDDLTSEQMIHHKDAFYELA